jgi:hypothetical protein
MHSAKTQRRPGILSGLWNILRPTRSRASENICSSDSIARREELKAAELRGDEVFLAAELSKAQLKAAANAAATKLTPMEQWPIEDFDSCQADAEAATEHSKSEAGS